MLQIWSQKVLSVQCCASIDNPCFLKCRFEQKLIYTVVLGRNYQKKNVQTKISSESVSLLVRPSEKPWFSQFELALFELFDFEFYLMKSVNRNLRFAVFLVFPKNGPLRRLLGTCLCYDQLFFYISATLCAIFMTLAPKMWRPQRFEVGWSAHFCPVFSIKTAF